MAIAFDATYNSGSVGASSGASWSHTCTGSDLVLYAAVNVVGDAVSTIKYNGVNMTLINDNTNGSNQISDYYLVNPATGTHTLALTFSGTGIGIQAGSISLTGVDQASPLDSNNKSTGTSTTPSLTITTVADNCWVLDGVGHYNIISNSFTSDSSQTERWNIAAINGDGAGGSFGPVTPAGAKVVSWGHDTSIFWAMVGASFKPSGVVANSNFFPFFQ